MLGSESRLPAEQYVRRSWWRDVAHWRLALCITGLAGFVVGSQVSASGGIGSTLEAAGAICILASLPWWSLPWGQSRRRERYFKLKSKWVEASYAGPQQSGQSRLADLDPPAAFASDRDELLQISRKHQLDRVDQSIPLPERYVRGVESRAASDQIVMSLEHRAQTPEELSYVAQLRDRLANSAEAWRAHNALREASMMGFVDEFAASKPPHGRETEFAALLMAQRNELRAAQTLRIAVENGDREVVRQACETWLTANDAVAAHEETLYGAAYPRVAHTRD